MRSSVDHTYRTHAALLLVAFSSKGMLCGRRSASGVLRTCSCFFWHCRLGASRAIVGRREVRRGKSGRHSAEGVSRTRPCCSWHHSWESVRADVGRPLLREAQGVPVLAVVVEGRVERSSVSRWHGAHAALLSVALSLGGKSCGRRSDVGCHAHVALLIVASSFGG